MRRALFVGRFQPFHKGHLEAVKMILKENDEVIIVIGSSQYSHNLENPFTAGERIVMIRKALEAEEIDASRYWLIPVPDIHIHMMWVSEVVGYTPKFQVVYSNEPVTRRLFIEAGFKVKPIPFIKRKIYSATEIRKRMLEDKNWEALVPKAVAEYIREIDGVQRIKELTKSDKV
ncbi:nicotinamide-nucleotide adenylyltransferase [Candidatus Bathyarchaeota archaeon]|nr:MAG: nicotinamide-nucleotide adenylyltransferase [Candidatus Bathyarchaeota archaeon]